MAHGPGLSIAIADKRFAPDAPLFRDFALTIAPGSVVALLGPSGIGKSSLLRLVAGIDRAFTGTIRIEGVDAIEAPPPGFVFQDARLLPWLTAIDNVRSADAAMSVAVADAALAQVGLAASAHAFPRQLSGGMQRRVAVARALAGSRELLLLDEPFVSLDRALVDELQQLLVAVFAATQPTVLFASHLPEDAARLADRVIVLEGRPARIVRDMTLSVPREARDASIIEDYRRQIAAFSGPSGP